MLQVYKEGKVSAFFGRMKEGEYLTAKGPKVLFSFLKPSHPSSEKSR